VAPDTDLNETKSFLNGMGGMPHEGGLGTNLYRLGVPEKMIQSILRHANVSTTNTYYIKSAADDTRATMARLERLVFGREHQVETTQSENLQVATKWQQERQTPDLP